MTPTFEDELYCIVPSVSTSFEVKSDRHHACASVSATERANYPEESHGVVKPRNVYISPIGVGKMPPKKRSKNTVARESHIWSGYGAGSRGVVTLGVFRSIHKLQKQIKVTGQANHCRPLALIDGDSGNVPHRNLR